MRPPSPLAPASRRSYRNTGDSFALRDVLSCKIGSPICCPPIGLPSSLLGSELPPLLYARTCGLAPSPEVAPRPAGLFSLFAQRLGVGDLIAAELYGPSLILLIVSSSRRSAADDLRREFGDRLTCVWIFKRDRGLLGDSQAARAQDVVHSLSVLGTAIRIILAWLETALFGDCLPATQMLPTPYTGMCVLCRDN